MDVNYDLVFTISGTAYKFMLVTPPGQTKQLSISEVEQPAVVRSPVEQEMLRQAFNPKVDSSLAQIDFSGGVGLLERGMDEQDNHYLWGSGIVTHTDGKVYLAPATTTLGASGLAADLVDFRTYLTGAGVRYDFTWGGLKLYRRDASNTSNAWVLVYTAGVAITDFTIHNGVGLICLPTTAGAGDDYYYQTDVTAAATWTPTAIATAAFSAVLGKPSFFCSNRSYIYAVVNPNKVFYTTDPVAGGAPAWTGPIDTSLTGNSTGSPGDLTYNFQGAVAVNDYLFLMKPNAIYSIDSQQQVTEVIWQWKDKPRVNGFKYFGTGQDLLFYAVGGEVYAYDPQTGRNTATGLSRSSGFSVQSITGVKADNQYVYALCKVRVANIRSATSMAMMRGVRKSASVWAWECIWEDTAITTYVGLGVEPYGDGSRVYWGIVPNIFHMDVPADWDESTSGNHNASGTLYASIWRTTHPAFIKRWLWVSTGATIPASTTIAIAYSTDEGVTFISLATLSSTGLTFTAFSSVNAQSVLLRYTLTNTSTTTPILRTTEIHARVRWRRLHLGKALVRIAENIELNNGTRDSTKATTLKANLVTIRTSDATIAYEDLLGHSFNVSIEDISYSPSRHERPENINEFQAQITFAEASSGA